MKKLMSLLIMGLFLMVLGCQEDSFIDMPILESETSVFTKSSTDLSPQEIEEMINGGVNWLLEQKNADGSFSGGGEVVARTSMAVVKLCDKSIEEGFQEPLAGPYGSVIQEALDFIIANGQDKGPDQKLYNIIGNAHHDNYNGSWALMAFCATRDPAYLTMAQEAANFFIVNQAPNGGWGYNAEGGWDDNQNWQDNSNTGYVLLSLVAAKNFGCSVPDAIAEKMGLQIMPENWIDYIQNDVDGDSDDGGSGYTNPNEWLNMLKTGNLLFEMAFVGDKSGDTRVQNAVDYIERHWNDPNNDPGFRPNNYQTMYTMMKGFTALGIDEINVGGSVDWYAEFVDIINATKQGSPGMYYWPPSIWTDEYLSTVFALLTLEKVVELPYQEVNLDIKPGSCPNPFNMKAKGLLPIAILGSPDCDITQINPETVTLEGVAPLRWDEEDVSAPVVEAQTECECTEAGPDGFMDKTFKFNRQELVANAPALQDVNDGDVVTLTLTGELYDGIQIIGVDCIVIIDKKKI